MGESGTAAATLHKLEFRGSGGEFFRIWIVNIVLTVLTLGIYSAWAKVRTTRYFYGNTFLAEHPFEYHASPVRILIGRLIAVGLLLGYSVSAAISPLLVIPWAIFFLFATPWLIVSSLRFSSRNSSYRNVRFNFIGTMGQAAFVYFVWPIIAFFTLFLTIPLARRARDYFFINNHTYGGRPFHTRIDGGSIYGIYILGLGLSLGASIAIFTIIFAGALTLGISLPKPSAPGAPAPPEVFVAMMMLIVPIYIVVLGVFGMIAQLINTMVFNLAVRNTVLDGRHTLGSTISPLRMAWIVVSNLFLVLITIGFYYPWARVRAAKYQFDNMSLSATSDLNEFTSEVIATQGAVGEEIAGFFDLGIGL